MRSTAACACPSSLRVVSRQIIFLPNGDFFPHAHTPDMASASSTELELSATEDDLAQAMRLLALEKRKRDAAFDAYGKTPGSDLLKAKYHVAQAEVAVARCEVAVARCRADVLDEGQSLAVAKARLRGIHPKRGEEYEEARKEYDEAEKMLEKAEARLKAASDELDKTKKELKETDGAGSGECEIEFHS